MLATYCEQGLFRYTAADMVGVAESTLRRWMAEGRRDIEDGKEETQQAKLRIAILAAEAKAEAVATLGIIAAGETDWRAFAWYLERKNNRRFTANPAAHEDEMAAPKVDVLGELESKLDAIEKRAKARADKAGETAAQE